MVQKRVNVAKLRKQAIAELKERVDFRRIDANDLVGLANHTIDLMKENIASGISPISGRRFPAYKNPPRYPGNRKPKRPVNLELTGEFLEALRGGGFKNGRDNVGFFVGFFDQDSIDKERGHREGANGQPLRPIIPSETEEFSRRITLDIEKEIERILLKAL